MAGKKNDLVTTEAAAETLGLDEAEVAELLKTGELRKVWHHAGNDSDAPLDSFVMGSDVKRLAQQSDPRYLAKVAAREIIEDDDEGQSARTLAADMPRL
jgi:hypothetical protein